MEKYEIVPYYTGIFSGSLNQEPDFKYHRSNAPSTVSRKRLAEQKARRSTIEEDIKAGKGQCGLDENETRGWKKRAADDGSRSPRITSPSHRPQVVGHRRNRGVEQLAHGAQSSG